MALEIERKFLVNTNNPEFRNILKKQTALNIKQGYLFEDDKKRVCRIRTTEFGNKQKAYITIKMPNKGAVREEFEYEIPFEDGTSLLKECARVLIKQRYVYAVSKGLKYEIDFFPQLLLTLAEIELKEENQEFDKPEWLLEDVTDNVDYYNNNLIKKIN